MPEVARRGYIRIDLADNCNIRCIMCQAYNSMPVNAMKFLDFDKFVQATRGELGKWDFIQLGNVAEATIHPKFAEFLHYVRAEAPQSTIHLVTNGKTLQKVAGVINEIGNCLIQLSMDSIRPEIHEYIREGSKYDRALTNLGMIDLTRNRVLLSFTLMASNIDEYPSMIEFCKDRGYHMSAFPMIVRSEIGVLPYRLLEESLWFRRDKLRDWLKLYYGSEYSMMIGTASGASQGVTEFSCNAHYQDLNINSGGAVNLCGKLTLGQLGTYTLQELWNNSLANDFRLQVETDREPCMTCDYRQRCLCPSMAMVDNHFSEEITKVISPATRAAIAYDRTISDDEARWLFVRDIGDELGVFDIQGGGTAWTARRMRVGAAPSEYEYGPELKACSRHELHDLMRRQAASGLYVELVESYGPYNIVTYMHRYWALPQALGHLNITQEGDRQKPGILVANSMAELKRMCSENLMPVAPPELVGSAGAYNLVTYKGRYWGIPLAYGPFDLTQPVNQFRGGLLVSESLEDLQRQCTSEFAILR